MYLDNAASSQVPQVVIDRGSILGAVAVALVAINTFGGFLVTDRMLGMFKGKKKPDG